VVYGVLNDVAVSYGSTWNIIRSQRQASNDPADSTSPLFHVEQSGSVRHNAAPSHTDGVP